MDNKKIYKGEWCISSSTPNRKERLKAHKEFEASDFKKMLDEGWQVKVTKPKRPRIQKSKTPREVLVSIFGGKVRMSFTEYQQRGQGFRVIMEIF